MLSETTVTTDASGSWGCGAWFAQQWFHLQWDSRFIPLPITEELILIILACAAWGDAWQGHQLLCQCDNQVAVGLSEVEIKDYVPTQVPSFC